MVLGNSANCCKLDFPVEVVHLHRLQCSKAKSWVVKRLKSYSISDNLQKNKHPLGLGLPSSTFCSLFEVTVYEWNCSGFVFMGVRDKLGSWG